MTREGSGREETGFLKKPGFLFVAHGYASSGIAPALGSVLVIIGAVVFTAAALPGQAGTTAARGRFYVTTAGAPLIGQGLAAAAPVGAALTGFQVVPAPTVRNVPNEAGATAAPWIDSNAWRFQRGLAKANYATLPAGSATLAAAEAFAFDADAILNPAPADLPELGNVLRFLQSHIGPPMPALANVGIVDDGSPQIEEILNMLTRRNVLYRVVKTPDPSLQLTVQVGTPEFPREAASNASAFVARVRAALGDDKRLVRLYGTTTVIARLTGDGQRARLVLLNFSRSRNLQNQQNVRARVLGRYKPSMLAAYGAPADARLEDVENPGNATEFLLPAFSVIAIIDLEPLK